MRVVVSPYHLTTREPVAMAALLLAERVVTLLPPPPEGCTREGLAEAVRKHPGYLRVLDSWRWSGALWRAGVIESEAGGTDAMADVRAVPGRVNEGAAWAGLRGVMGEGAHQKPGPWLEAWSEDVLKGGPSPEVSVSVASGLDALAAREGMIAARSGVTRLGGGMAQGSISQRAEALMGETIAGVSLPVLLRADGETLLRARAEFEPELKGVRDAVDAGLAAGLSPSRAGAVLRKAGNAYAKAFEACRGEFVGRDDEHGERVTAGYVTVSVRRVPADAVLLSALAAVRTMGAGAGSAAGREGRTEGTVAALVVSESGVQPGGSSPADL